MDTPHTHLIVPGAGDGPPPPLAGALAAWLMREGHDVVVVGAQGARSGRGTCWVHLEAGERPGDLPLDVGLRFFGPGVDDPDARRAADRFPGSTCVIGDPEPTGARIEDLDSLPITTWAGFDRPGPAFRVLAGRGDRWRSPGHLLREVAYLVETFGAGHLLFDDADLAGWGDGLARFEAGLARLPWALTWEATVDGGRRAGGRGRRLGCRR